MQHEDDETAFEPLSDDERRFLDALQNHTVGALVIGGYAARVHGVREGGRLRDVEDLDLVIDTGNENLERLRPALLALEVHSADTVITGFREKRKAKWRWRDGHDDHCVDVLSELDVADFVELWEAAVSVSHEGLQLRVIGREHFIKAKRSALIDHKRGPKTERDRKDLFALLGSEEAV